MRSLRLVAATLVLALVAFACGGDDEETEEPNQDQVTSTTRATSTNGDQPSIESIAPTTSTTTTEAPGGNGDVVAENGDDPPVVPDPPNTTVAAPLPPTNVRCVGGTNDGELLVEWDALSNPSDISKIRVYVSEDGGPFITNGEFTMGQVDTTRSGGTRWAAPARRLTANVPLRLTATSFNLLGDESGWYITNGSYTGAGQPCGTDGPVLPPTTCTAGCDEEEGEPAP